MINVYALIDAKGVPWFKRGKGFNRGLTVVKIELNDSLCPGLKKNPPGKSRGVTNILFLRVMDLSRSLIILSRQVLRLPPGR